MNSSKNKVLLLIIGILLLSNIALLVFMFGAKEAEKPGPKENKGGGLSEYLKKEVGFNQQQATQYDKLRKDHRARMQPLFEDLRNTKIRFYLQLRDSSLTDSEIDSSARTIGDKQAYLDGQIFRHFRRVRALTTSEQASKFDSIYPNIIKKMTEGPRRNDRRQDSTSQGKQ